MDITCSAFGLLKIYFAGKGPEAKSATLVISGLPQICRRVENGPCIVKAPGLFSWLGEVSEAWNAETYVKFILIITESAVLRQLLS